MDFWSRLLNPLSTGTPRKEQAKDPAKRLHRFDKEYKQLLSTWRTSTNLSRDSDAAETLEIRLQELTNILSDESRRPLPHPCIQYASNKQVYVPVGKIATTSQNEWIIKEAVLFFATLIESEEEAFVENSTFSNSLTNLLVKITGMNSVRLGLDTESRVVELAFNITTKIRLEPEILPAWFRTTTTTTQQQKQVQNHGQYRGYHQQQHQQHGGDEERDDHDGFAGRTQREDFPLFYILMDYIHHEGKVGDFARTGLLYIIEAASSSAALEQWIVESDLSTLMATGLGALYSQLSRKLVIDHPRDDLPPILALSDYQHPASSFEIVSSCSPEFQSHLETFLSHLLFWQDVLNHCKSVEVKSTLLEHFQVIFLQQLLYPSLLESSDIDGGSSVAVLTYLRRILESLEHPDMINLILHYLLALPDTSAHPKKSASTTSISDARKRKSMDLASMMAEKSDTAATPLLFNLVDLILACLRSRNQQTIHVTLQLVSAILKKHHRYAIITLLRTDALPGKTTHRTVGAHEQEIEYLMSLAGSVGGQENFDAAYENVLKDTMTRVEGHPCSLKLVAPRVSMNSGNTRGCGGGGGGAALDSLPGAPREVREHALRADDPLLNALLDLLENFFVNPVETNLSTTETIVDLAICGYMSIEGWLVRSPASYRYEDEDQEEEEEEVMEISSRQPEDVVEETGGVKEAVEKKEVETSEPQDVVGEIAEQGEDGEKAEEKDVEKTEMAEEKADEKADENVEEHKPEEEETEEDKANEEKAKEEEAEDETAKEEKSDENTVKERLNESNTDECKADVETASGVKYDGTNNTPEHVDGKDVQEEEAPEPKDPNAAEEAAATEQKETPLTQPVEESEEVRREKDMRKCRRRPRWEQQGIPRTFDVLQRLCDQVTRYKETVPRFGELLQQRREAFQTADTMLEEPTPMRRATPAMQQHQGATPERLSLDELSRSGSPARPSGLEGFAQRLLSELGTPSRSSSPRGRREQSRSSGAASPIAAGYSTPRGGGPPPVPPKDYPAVGSVHRDSGRSAAAAAAAATAASRGLSPHDGVSSGRDPAVESQASAFAAIDQSILSRKVGLPSKGLRPIPLRFDKKPMAEPVEEEAEDEDEDVDASVEDEEPTSPGQGAKARDAGSGKDDDRQDDESSSRDVAGGEAGDDEEEEVSVSHVITNVIIFQSFIFELASLMQVRAGLFNEVRFV